MTLHICKMNMCKKYYLIHYSVRDIIKYQFKEHCRNLESTSYLSTMSIEMSSRPYIFKLSSFSEHTLFAYLLDKNQSMTTSLNLGPSVRMKQWMHAPCGYNWLFTFKCINVCIIEKAGPFVAWATLPVVSHLHTWAAAAPAEVTGRMPQSLWKVLLHSSAVENLCVAFELPW